MARLLEVDGEKLKKLRISGGWETTEEFANDVGVSKGAIERAESNGRNFAGTIKMMAATLQLKDWKELLAPPAIRDGIITIELHLGMSKEEFQQALGASNIVRIIEEHTPLRNEIKKVVVSYGSVKVKLLCHSEDAAAFVYALATRKLDNIKLIGVRFLLSDIRRSCTIDTSWHNEIEFKQPGSTLFRAQQPHDSQDDPDRIYRVLSVDAHFEFFRGWFFQVLDVMSIHSSRLCITIDDESLSCRKYDRARRNAQTS